MMFTYFATLFLLLAISPTLSQYETGKSCIGENDYYDELLKSCEKCPTVCPEGYGYFETKCGNGKMEEPRCTPCTEGTFSNNEDDQRCYPCNLCLNRQILENCTTTSRAKCGTCINGYGWDESRKVCKKCEHARKLLPGCEAPPQVVESVKKVRILTCKWENTGDEYTWYKDESLLDTSDENKFVIYGNKLFIFDQDINDEGKYKCKAKFNADNNNNIVINEMSSNEVLISNNLDEVSRTNTTRTVRKGFNCWTILVVSLPVLFIVGVLIPNKFIMNTLCWVIPKLSIRFGCENQIEAVIYTDTTTAGNGQDSSIHNNSAIFSIDTFGSGDVSFHEDPTVTSAPSEKSTLIGKFNEPEGSLENAYLYAINNCQSFYYRDLDINTTDELQVYLNPRPDPDPPVKYWKHLADELGFKNRAVLDHLGSYRHFHDILCTRELPLKTFLEALWKVENARSIKIVSDAVKNLNDNKQSVV